MAINGIAQGLRADLGCFFEAADVCIKLRGHFESLEFCHMREVIGFGFDEFGRFAGPIRQPVGEAGCMGCEGCLDTGHAFAHQIGKQAGMRCNIFCQLRAMRNNGFIIGFETGDDCLIDPLAMGAKSANRLAGGTGEPIFDCLDMIVQQQASLISTQLQLLSARGANGG